VRLGLQPQHDGRAVFIEDQFSRFLGKCSFNFYGENYWVQVSANGFAPSLMPLTTLTGEKRDIADPIPPPMQIGLIPFPAAGGK
jgi:hypothetical protein